MGLAGSGKTYLIKSLVYDYMKEENFANGDDAEKQNIKELIIALNEGKFCIVSERKYRSKENREEFLKKINAGVTPLPSIHYICFEGDLGSANHNCKKRPIKNNDKDGNVHIDQNRSDIGTYDIPDNAIVVKIHRI